MRRACLLLALLASCGGPRSVSTPPPAEPPVWVLAPHPDDEALMAAHVIATAVAQGRPVWVQVMTNGDLGCERDGWLRERETVAAMAELGLPEERIRFLGYPDGFLDALGAVPLAPLERRTEDGACTRASTTYAGRGEAGVDVHTALSGAPAIYTDASAIGDLVALLERDRPSDVYTAHPIDDHPDHATTYVLLRRALERARLDRLPTIHRALVHAGGCWPNGSSPTEPCPEIRPGSPYPPLPGPLASYVPSERVVVPDGGARARRAIGRYASQLHTDVDTDWLGTFGRPDAIYWSETLLHEDGRLVRARAPGVERGEARALGAPSGGRIAIAQRAPIAASFDAAVPEAGSATLRVLGREADPAAGIEVEIAGGNELVIRSGGRVLDRVHVADDGARDGRHRWSLRVEPRPDEGDVAELEIRRDGELLAVAIDPSPPREGDLVTVSASAGAEVGEVGVSAP